MLTKTLEVGRHQRSTAENFFLKSLTNFTKKCQSLFDKVEETSIHRRFPVKFAEF